MPPRIIQNFSGSRALIATRSQAAVEGLQTTLAKLGMTSEYPDWTESGLIAETAQHDRDMLFIDGDLDWVVTKLSEPNFVAPVIPVIGIIGIEAPGRLKALLHLGATAFLRKPVHGASVYSALFLGINQFQNRQDAQAKMAEMERKRNGRRFVVSAVVRLMTRTGLGEEEAFSKLRRESMSIRVSIEDYCERYCNAATANEEDPIDLLRKPATL